MRGASAASLMEWDGVGTLALSTCLPGYDDESIVTIVCGWRERGRACGYGACGPPSRAGRVEDGVNMMASSPRHGGSISAATRVGVVELHAPCARAAGSRPVLPRSRGFSAETGQRHRQRQRTEGVRPRGASPRSLGVYLYGQNLFHLVWIRWLSSFRFRGFCFFGDWGEHRAHHVLCVLVHLALKPAKHTHSRRRSRTGVPRWNTLQRTAAPRRTRPSHQRTLSRQRRARRCATERTRRTRLGLSRGACRPRPRGSAYRHSSPHRHSLSRHVAPGRLPPVSLPPPPSRFA